jgi:hypothetical protein
MPRATGARARPSIIINTWRGVRADRHSNANLAGSLRDRETGQAVDADAGYQRAQPAQDHREGRNEPFLPKRVVDPACLGADAEDIDSFRRQSRLARVP